MTKVGENDYINIFDLLIYYMNANSSFNGNAHADRPERVVKITYPEKTADRSAANRFPSVQGWRKYTIS